MKFVRVDGRLATELCPYTCGKCPHLPSASSSTTKTVNLQIFMMKISNFVLDNSTNIYEKGKKDISNNIETSKIY